MSAAPDISITRHWLLPSCGQTCQPGNHDPRWHEAIGMRTALLTPPATVVRTGPLTVDLREPMVAVDGQEVHVSGREWGMLRYLAVHVGRRCPTREILVAVWGREWDRGRPDDMHITRTNLSRLRGRLGAAASLIESNVRGTGPTAWYCLRLEPAS